MAFESLSERHEFQIAAFPEQWLPLIYLYDPDLPLFPLHYFHVLDPTLPLGERPGEHDRAYGFIHHVNFVSGSLTVSIALNKDLADPRYAHFRDVVEKAARERLGLGDPIRVGQLSGSLTGTLSHANTLVNELWYRVIKPSFGDTLPFGRMWDEVFGLVRFIASFRSDGGRKGELIQTHYFMTAFGERIATGGGIHVDFYLLPTYAELISTSNPLSLFPKFAQLVQSAAAFISRCCSSITIGGMKFSQFRRSMAGIVGLLDTPKFLHHVNTYPPAQREALYENYNAFNRGPHRSIIALMMIHDLRSGNWSPAAFTPSVCADMYTELGGSYQAPKVIQLYAQQCFGSVSSLPIDNWVSTFLQWPFAFSTSTAAAYHSDLFACSSVWGKLERLIWICSQARKVHSSVCAEILWCVRYGRLGGGMRGANPLSCKICEAHIRAVCPAYDAVRKWQVHFNGAPPASGQFQVTTSAGNNTSPGQTIVGCYGTEVADDYSVRDRASKFSAFPATGHGGTPLTVEDFLLTY